MHGQSRTETNEAPADTPSAAGRLFAGPGSARALARSLDWASTPLGPVDGWPRSLRTAVDICLGSRFPTALLWGPGRVMIHNEAHIPILGARFPRAMGRPAHEVLSDSWPVLGRLVERALASENEPVAPEPVDIAVTFARGAGPQPGYLTVSISVVRDESGQAGGVIIAAVDMTARVRAEETLSASEARYRGLATASADVIYRMSPDWREMRRLDGRGFLADTAEPSETWLERYIDPDDRARVTAAIETAVREKRVFELEHRVVRADGTLGWTFSRAVPILDTDGEIVEWIGAASDVTTRKETEEALRTSEERIRRQNEALRSAVDGKPLAESLGVLARMVAAELRGEARTAFYIADPEGARLHPVWGAGDMPDAYLELVNGFLIGEDSLACGLAVPTGRPVLTRDVLDEPRWTPWTHVARAHDYRGCWSFPIKTREKRAIGTFAMYFRTPREATPRELSLADVVTQTAAVITASHTDAQERLRAEASLRESESRFRAVADLVPDLLWEVEPDGSTSWYNERWTEYTGQSRDDALRHGWMDVIHPDDRERSAASQAQAITRGEALVAEHRFRRHDGTYRWFLVHVEPRRSATGEIVRWFGAATDVHAQRMALEEAERLAARRAAESDALRRQLLEAEETERRRLARELHDEAGQHLTALGLGLQTLSDLTPPGSEVDRRATQLRALAALMSRELHAIAVRLRPKSLDDFGLEAALAAYVEEWARQAQIGVEIHARTDAERLPSAVESAVYRVVQEALTNVAKHSGATRASVVVERRDGQVVAIVEDDGHGFDADALGADLRQARGLGLLGIRERAVLLGGTAELESTPGQGTTVFVRIPIDAGGPAGNSRGDRRAPGLDLGG